MYDTILHKLFYCFIVLILLNIAGCGKQELQEMDDSRYIVDLQAILILCENSEGEAEYTDALHGLKGNGDEILASITQLEGLKQTVAVKNAIGVGKNLLRKADEGKKFDAQG